MHNVVNRQYGRSANIDTPLININNKYQIRDLMKMINFLVYKVIKIVHINVQYIIIMISLIIMNFVIIKL